VSEGPMGATDSSLCARSALGFLFGGEVEPGGGWRPMGAESPTREAIVEPCARGIRDRMQTAAGMLLFLRVQNLLSPL
jgi:hypothetical protein